MESIQIFFCKNKAVKIGLFGDTLFFPWNLRISVHVQAFFALIWLAF